MAKTAKSVAKRFRAALEKDGSSLGWTIARVPFDPAKSWPTMIRLRVRGEVNGAAFRTSLFPDVRGGFCLLVNKAMQREAGVRLGAVAEFSLEPDLEPRPAELPDELAVLLDEEPGLRAWYDGLSEYMRREMGKWIAGVTSAEARMRRAEQMAERMLATMEAEQELPPLIARSFRARPRAMAGWKQMTAAQRRGELFAVFYYRTPEARQRRVAKLLEAAEKRAPA
jgi:uncharacterized protein YdeI (YjbR/CyaY-like superfamily)